MLTADIDAGFNKGFPAACKQIGCDPKDLLSVMMSESGVAPEAHNPNGDASGLIQFMPATLVALGWTQGYAAFMRLAASAQLPYVVAYYRPWAKAAGAWDSAGRLYQATFLPGTLASARLPQDTLCAKGGTLGWAYSANAVFDENGDGRITIQELTDSTLRAARGNLARWNELLTRIGIDVDVAQPGDDDLVSASSVQHALNLLQVPGTPLAEDGIIGPKSIAAIRAFQLSKDLHVDGIAGPETRGALIDALAAMSVSPNE